MRAVHAARLAAALAVLAAAVPAHAESQSDAALRNYLAVVEGRVRYSDLPARDRYDVDEVARLVREKKLVIDLRTSEQRCRDNEARRAQGQPSDLAARIIDMKCREAF